MFTIAKLGDRGRKADYTKQIYFIKRTYEWFLKIVLNPGNLSNATNSTHTTILHVVFGWTRHFYMLYV